MKFNFTIDSGGCYGRCIPEKFVINENGKVDYYVYSKYKLSFQLTKFDFMEILKIVKNSDFFKHEKSEYTEPTYDVTRINLIITINDITKKIKISHRYGTIQLNNLFENSHKILEKYIKNN